MNDFSANDLRELIEAQREGTAGEEQHARLEEMLRTDPGARRYYVRYLMLCANLRTLMGGEGDDRDELADGPEPPPFPRVGEGFAPCSDVPDAEPCGPPVLSMVRPLWLWRLGFAAALLAGVLAAWGTFDFSPAPQPAPVATLAAAVDAQWGGPAMPPAPGAVLPSGPLQLKYGLAELRFASGATVILEGPAECVLDSAHRLTLHRGRLAANVSDEAIGFTVRTPDATVVDLGTEFGVCSQDAGATDVHVFRGQVALVPGRDIPEDKRLLSGGAARRVEAGGARIHDMRADELAFVRPDEFEARVKAMKHSPYHRWLVYCYGLRREPALVLYYTFDNEFQAPDRLLNLAGSTAGRLDGVLPTDDLAMRPEWSAAGRWPQQRALHFNADGRQQVRVPHSNKLNITQAMTLAAWIRPNAALLDSVAVIATKSAPDAPVGPNYELGLLREEDARGSAASALYLQCGGNRVASGGMQLAPGTWVHVAAVVGNGAAVLYVDGRPVAQGEMGELVPNNGDLLIGSAHGAGAASQAEAPGAFEGLMSELVLVRRMMSGEEVQAMYTAGRPEL